VEIRKDNEVKKIIDTGSQFWSFKKRSLIEIFDMHRIQNILHIKMGSASIRSFDNRGSLQDEFIINKMDDNCIALHSTKTVEDAKYDIIYYLDKVKDSTAEEIKNAY
jgi:hypothetical protein